MWEPLQTSSISIHALREEGDWSWPQGNTYGNISIHALREEGDRYLAFLCNRLDDFYPRPPRGGRPGPCYCDGIRHFDFYPRPPRGGRLIISLSIKTPLQISIHALREEGDVTGFARVPVLQNFYPRPPRGGRRPSTRAGSSLLTNFYPRPPRGGRRPGTRQAQKGRTISIHALREEGDGRSARGRTRFCNFYPRPPRGGRHAQAMRGYLERIFLSTPSARRATSAGSL